MCLVTLGGPVSDSAVVNRLSRLIASPRRVGQSFVVVVLSSLLLCWLCVNVFFTHRNWDKRGGLHVKGFTYSLLPLDPLVLVLVVFLQLFADVVIMS